MANNKKFVVKNGLRTHNIDFTTTDLTKTVLMDIDNLGDLNVIGEGKIVVGDYDDSSSVIGPTTKIEVIGNITAFKVKADFQGDVFGQDSSRLVDSNNGEFNGFLNGQVSSLDNHTTDDLDEGTQNLYFTKQRARREARIMALIFGSN